MMRIGFAILLIATLSSCSRDSIPERPANVPSAAIWSGGPDGGDWFDCAVIPGEINNHCTIYADVTGVVIETGDYQLRTERRAATRDELQYAYYSEGEINLRNNKVLIRVERGHRPGQAVDGEYVGLENLPNLSPWDKDVRWFRENTLLIRKNEAILDKVPITIKHGNKEYSASDGGFLTYRAKFVQSGEKSLVELRLCQSDYIAFPINQRDHYSEIKTIPVKVSAEIIEIDGVQYRRTKVDETTRTRLNRLLNTGPMEKTVSKK